jgi:hypothetical protein
MCVGANTGTVQLMGLCHLLCARYRLTVDRPEDLTMALRFASRCADQDRRLSRNSREIVRDP